MADTTIVIPSGTRLDKELERIATETGHAKDEVALNALNEWLEDLADARSALEVISRNEPTISLEELRRELGLER
jgi:hypothetical protein